jgi:hypothetical protein
MPKWSAVWPHHARARRPAHQHSAPRRAFFAAPQAPHPVHGADPAFRDNTVLPIGDDATPPTALPAFFCISAPGRKLVHEGDEREPGAEIGLGAGGKIRRALLAATPRAEPTDDLAASRDLHGRVFRRRFDGGEIVPELAKSGAGVAQKNVTHAVCPVTALCPH